MWGTGPQIVVLSYLAIESPICVVYVMLLSPV